MRVSVLTPPDPFLELDETKEHLRIDDDDNDGVLTGLIAAVCGWLDGPSGWLGRSVGLQTLELRDRAFACDRLPYGPLVEVEDITYLDSSGAEQTLAEDQYRVFSDGSLHPLVGGSWPSVYGDDDAVRITYSAGYPPEGEEAVSTVPGPLKTGALLAVAFLFKNREASPEDALTSGGVAALLNQFRVWSV